MPWLAPLLAGILVSVAQSIVYRVIAALGIGLVSYAGINLLVDQVKNFIINQLGSAGILFDIVSLFGFGVAINIAFSAVAIRLTLSGLKADGSLMKMVSKGK